ncbi:predicted protein [Naegleria gruberi]|uniref:Predicted protein n=1 Tax=Naegleria gruberi TaxID=5762 RepID=D2VYM7_NAEGR|nr:uncharacterized protein NAEGRDRAFT_74175 [Naegleria gruberi]EFC38083.1 predicted protein [Naegleria gruberi]|eukprot:XP_002670827.1 predicted protein [Naegleria gruberi strain NEG-M]
MRRFENSIVSAVAFGKLGSSIGGIVCSLANNLHGNELGVGLTGMTIVLVLVFALIGYVTMEIYTRYVIKTIKSRYLTLLGEGSLEREAGGIFQQLEEQENVELLDLYGKFVMMSNAKSFRLYRKEIVTSTDLQELIGFIRGISTQKTVQHVNLLLTSASLVAYFIPDESNSTVFANALIKRAVKQHPSTYFKYKIGQKAKEVEVYASEQLRGAKNMIELKSILRNIEKQTTELTSLHRHYFKELMQEMINYKKVEQILHRAAVLTGSLDSIFDNILRLYYNDKTVLRTYASYMESFKFNREIAQEYYGEAMMLEDEESQAVRKPPTYITALKKRSNTVTSLSESIVDTDNSRRKMLNSVAFNNIVNELSEPSVASIENFEGIENQNEAKRELVYRTALESHGSRAMPLIFFSVFILFSLALIAVGLGVGYSFSLAVTENVVNVIDACSPIASLTNLIITLRGFQATQNLLDMGVTLQPTLTNRIYSDMTNTKSTVKTLAQLLTNLQQKAYDAKLTELVYSRYHEYYYTILIPLASNRSSISEKFYFATTEQNVTITDINNVLLKITTQLLTASKEDLMKTVSSYEYMYLYRNQEKITRAYSDFCKIFMISAKDDAVTINTIFTYYISFSLSVYIVFGFIFLIIQYRYLSGVKKQIKLMQENVSKNEIGKLFHDLGKKVSDDTHLRASRNALLTPKNLFSLFGFLTIVIVSICCGIYLSETLGNSTYSFESYVTMEDGFDAMSYLQHTTFAISEVFIHAVNAKFNVSESSYALLGNSDIELMATGFTTTVKSLRYYWNLCMYGSAVKAYETLVVGMFTETDDMIRGEVNCDIEASLKTFEKIKSSGNSTTYCKMGVDYMVQDIILKCSNLKEDIKTLPQLSNFKSTSLNFFNEFYSIAYLTNAVSMKLIDFSNVFAVKSATPRTEQMISLAIIALILSSTFFGIMYYSIDTYWKDSHIARSLFNYLSIDTLESNEIIKNYVLYHTTNDGIKRKKKSTEESKVNAILNAAVDGVVVCDAQFWVKSFNPAASRMFGAQQEEFVNKPIYCLMTPWFHDDVRKFLNASKNNTSLNDAKSASFEVDCVRTNLSTFSARINLFITVFDKKPIVTCFIKDITSEKKHNSLLQEERKHSEDLLLNILPSAVATKLKGGASLIAEKFPDVTCFFSDMVGFTALSSKMGPNDLVQMLNTIVIGFDDLMDVYHLEKIKTIGDAYFCAGGLHDLNAQSDHPERTLRFAIDTFGVIRNYNLKFRRNNLKEQINIRIGINTGPVVAGVIGRKKFAYDLWGDSINTASRMESNSKPGRIQVSRSTYERVFDLGLVFEERKIEVKGKGMCQTYLLDAKHHTSAIITEEDVKNSADKETKSEIAAHTAPIDNHELEIELVPKTPKGEVENQ